MKKFLSFIVALSLFAVCSPAHALQNWGENDLNRALKQVFNTNSVQTTDSGSQIAGVNATGDLNMQTYLIANGRYGSTAFTMPSSSTGGLVSSIPYAMIIKNIGGAGVDLTPGLTLVDGLPGQVLEIIINGVGSGTCQFLVTPTHKTGYTSLTFTATKQIALLEFDSTLGWMLLSYTGVTVNL